MNMKTKLMLALALASLGAACGGGEETSSGDSQVSSGGEIGQAVDSTYDGPVSGDAALGAEVFATFCDGCHPNGESGIGPSLIDHPESPADSRRVIREGDGRMPGFDQSQISDSDLENVLAHLQASYGMF